jgi:quinol monooxygenase YgiN
VACLEAPLPEPIVFISTHKIKEGKLDDFTRFSREMTPLIEASKPSTVFFQPYLNEAGNEVTIIHVFPDADSMDSHFQGADQRSARAYEFLQPVHFEIYGTPSDQVLSTMRQMTASLGAPLTLKSQPLAGFIRLGSG